MPKYVKQLSPQMSILDNKTHLTVGPRKGESSASNTCLCENI